jgi:hypothetical protein
MLVKLKPEKNLRKLQNGKFYLQHMGEVFWHEKRVQNAHSRLGECRQNNFALPIVRDSAQLGNYLVSKRFTV